MDVTELERTRALIAEARDARQETMEARDRFRVAVEMARSNLDLAHQRLRSVSDFLTIF